MECIFDGCKLVNDLVLGILSSFLTTGIIWLYKKSKDKNKYSKAAGRYNGFSTLEKNPRKLSDKPISEAEIVYERENRLRIEVTHDKGTRKWIGLIIMDNEHNGSIAWEYVNMPLGEVEFGFKNCIVSRNGDKVMLVEKSPPRHEGEIIYGREILIRK
jgi:hypothetical protein